MSSIVQQHDIGDLITVKNATALTSATAGGTGDNTAITGITIDRAKLNMPLSAAITLLFTAVLGATNTLTLKTCKVEDSADGSTFATYNAFTDPGVVATGPSGGGTVSGESKLIIDLQSARRYVRFDFTPDLSAANTDTAIVGAAWSFGGENPVPAV